MADPLALLMSDLVDSTGTSHRLGPQASERMWADHDRQARVLLARWGGVEIDKSDGFLMVFASAVDACRYALDYLQALSTFAEPLQARVGVHLAPVAVRQNSEQEVASGAKAFEIENWIAKALVSRLMSLAHGQQILVSEAAAATLVDTPLRVRRHGHWRAKGVTDPMAVFEAGDAGTNFRPPADSPKAWRVVERDGVWLPAREVRHSLPSEPNSLVGRSAELLAMADALQGGCRLLSILGLGGVGKTRVALRLGWQGLGDHPGGVWFCDLSAAQDLDTLTIAVAQGLQISVDQTDPMAQIGQTIAARGDCMVILDNFDRLIAWAGDTVACWMQAAPGARFVVTSRQVLALTGERSVPLAPLPTTDGVALFERRAHEAAPDRTGAGQADPAVHELVQMLDGLPLAIELAAARVRVLTPRQMLDRMGQRFLLLAGPGRPRQRQSTLRAALDWSWDLLSTPERCALAQLSVFEGGFSLADAEAVIDAGDDAPWLPDLVQSLVEKSMLRLRGSDRFDLLRNVQDYAAEQLATAGRFPGSGPEGLQAARRRHWQHLATGTTLTDDAALEVSIDNLVAACRRATAAGDADAASRTLLLAWQLLRRTGPYRVTVDLSSGVLALDDLPPAQRSHVARAAATAHEGLGHADAARESMEQALHLARQANDATAEAWALVALGEHRYKRGPLEASREALDLALQRGGDDPGLRCAALNALGNLELRIGRARAARQAYQQALQLARERGDATRIGGLLGNLAILAHDAGDTASARAQYEEALALTVRGHDRRWEGNTRCNLGLLLQESGDDRGAEDHFQRALQLAREVGHALLEATVLCNLGILYDARDEITDACIHHEHALAIARRLGDRRAIGQFCGYLGEALARDGRAEEGLHRLAEGEALLRESNDETSVVLLLCQRAVAEFLAGQHDQAAGRLAVLRVLARPDDKADLRRAIERADRLMKT